MYRNQLIAIVKKDGQPLRETEGKFVYLPFNSEYSIELKNQSNRRAVASIKIDGTDVLGGDEIIIPAYGSVPIERFITNGDLSKGKKFKFVPLSDSKVQDPSSAENGLVEIEVWFEKPPEISYYDASHLQKLRNRPRSMGGQQTNSAADKSSTEKRIFPDSGNVMYCCSAINSFDTSLSRSVGSVGATVEGSVSVQSFVTGTFGKKDYPSVSFKFWLKGVEQEVTATDKLYCTSCGKKTRFDYKYCPRCGNPVQIA